MKKFLSLVCFSALFSGAIIAQTQYNATTYHQFNTNYGYIQVGAQNASWAHFYTDRPMYYFNKEIRVYTGCIGSYNSALFLRTSGTTRMTIDTHGNVGVGISQPNAKLDINGSLKISGSNHLIFAHPNGNGVINFGNNGVGNLYFRSLSTGGDISSFNHLMILTYDGRLGIGTWDPGNYKLAVNGSIRAKSIVVETNWSDFVFESGYKLRTLNEVSSFIIKNGHLPEIPSAEEVGSNGINVGEMQSKLLQKIEELTLYLIEIEKNNESLKERISFLENQLKSN